MMTSDLAATWDVPMPDGIHEIKFEHGTTTGKRVILVDGKELRRVEWMFKLVGKEHFTVGKAKCCIIIEAVSGFNYEYSLEVNGKPLQKYSDAKSKIECCWRPTVGGNDTRVVLEKDTLDVWVNGSRVETTGEFSTDDDEDGTETHFVVGGHPAYIKAISSGNRRRGIIHKLFVDDVEVPQAKE